MNVLQNTMELMMAAEAMKDSIGAVMNISDEVAFESFIAGLVSTWREVHGKTVDDEVHMYRMMAKMVRDLDAVREEDK